MIIHTFNKQGSVLGSLNTVLSERPIENCWISGRLLLGNVEEALRWLDQAKADLKTAADCMKDGNHYASTFFSQQSAEKALKGFLYSTGLRAIITHSVVELLERSSELNAEFERFIDEGRELDRHYIGSRYPNFYPEGPAYKYYTKEIAQRCLSYAESILKEAEKYVRK